MSRSHGPLHPRAALAAGLAALVPALGCSEPDPPPARHLVLVVIDTLRADAVGCYGAGPEATPRIDALAAEGAVFEVARAASSWTVASTATLLTGMTPLENGMLYRFGERLPVDVPYLAAVLSEAGFACGGVSCNSFISREYGFARGFDGFERLPSDTPGSRAVEHALAWSRDQGDARRFLYVHLFDPHWPYVPDGPEARAAELAPSPIEDADLLALASRMARGDLVAARRLVEWTEWARGAYAACVASADRAVGELLDGLRADGLLDDALVVVTSDHGEEFGEHGSIGHARQMHEETLRVPLVMAGPGIPAGDRHPEPVDQRHVPATVLPLLGLPTPTEMFGARLDRREDRRAQAEEAQVFALEQALWFDAPDELRPVRTLLGLQRGDRRLLWAFDGAFDEGRGRVVEVDAAGDERPVATVDGVEDGGPLLDELRARWAEVRPLEAVEDEATRRARLEEMRALGYSVTDDGDE